MTRQHPLISRMLYFNSLKRAKIRINEAVTVAEHVSRLSGWRDLLAGVRMNMILYRSQCYFNENCRDARIYKSQCNFFLNILFLNLLKQINYLMLSCTLQGDLKIYPLLSV